MADPRSKSEKKFYMKVFVKKELYDEFLKYYDQAVADGSASPEDKAMVIFRDRYEETEDGWIERAT